MKALLTLLISILIFFTNLSFAQIQSGSFIFDGQTRNYMVFLPSNYPGTINFPLVIYLHNYGWSAATGMNYTLLHQVADTSDFIVVYPNAIPNWNSGIGDNPNWPTPNVDDVGFINALIDTLSNHYSIDLERIYACGYSNGGFMSYKLACDLNHRIAAIASVGGVISTSTAVHCHPRHTIPVLQIHGTQDPYVPINGHTGWHSVNMTLSYWINFNNCVQVDTTILPDLDPNDGCTVKKISYTICTNNSNIIYYKVINGGHTWPGAGPPGYSAGNTNQDINANVEIWNFFKNYRRVTSIESIASSTPKEYRLLQNYPNPFNPTTKIKYDLPKASTVKIEIFNLLGQKIQTLLNKPMPAGSHEVEFTAKNLPSGVYLYRIDAGDPSTGSGRGFQEVRKMILMK